MRRPLLLAQAALAALTALALLGTAVAVRPTGPPARAAGTDEAANRALVLAFYDAANAVIAGGEPTPLVDLFADHFVDRGDDHDREPGGDHLVRRLLAIRAAAPNLRLVVDHLAADGDLVLAQIRLDGPAPRAFLGLQLDDAWTAWGPVDVFRVAGGRVVEHATVGDRPLLLEPLAAAPVALAPPADRAVSVRRVDLPAGGWRRVSGVTGLQMLIVAAGAVVVTGASEDGTGRSPGDGASMLGAGGWIVLANGPTGTSYLARNLGPAPAVFLEVGAAAPPPRGTVGTAVSAEGEPGQLLAGSRETTIATVTGPAVLAVGRAMLPPGARLAWAGPPGPVLLGVEAGTLGLATAGEVAWVRRATGAQVQANGMATLAAGDGALLGAGTGAEVRSTGDQPLELLVLTLLGASDGHT